MVQKIRHLFLDNFDIITDTFVLSLQLGQTILNFSKIIWSAL